MDFVERVYRQTENLREIEGACGICHGTLETIIGEGGKARAFEEPEGVLAVIRNDQGDVIGEGFDIVWSPAILSAEIDAGLIPVRMRSKLVEDSLSREDDVGRVASLFGYGRVLTPSVPTLQYVNEQGGRTLIRREGIGVAATMWDGGDVCWRNRQSHIALLAQ